MTSMKKLEIVIDSMELSAVTAVLDKVGVPGYTVIDKVTGRGTRGGRGADDLAGPPRSGYVFTACLEAQARAVAEAVRPLLRQSGGACLVTDCLWVEH
jgi:nitrogen regulatory protein PII